MIEAYKKFWKGYVDFKGRSTRSDYWLNVLAQCLVYLLFSFLLILIMILGGDSSTYTSDPYSFQMILVYIVVLGIGVYALASLVPSIAIIVRRLRDAGYHWALIFLSLIPYLCGFIIFILTLQPTKVEVAFNNFNNPQQ
ncbi:MAG: DUF805 domain-containing protein [Streptococcus salivarius]